MRPGHKPRGGETFGRTLVPLRFPGADRRSDDGERRMSRGLGILQHRVCEALYAADGREPPLRELRRRLGDPHRSNLRRAIRGLLERGLVEEFESGGSVA
jgi:hypothetical protein